MQNAIPEYLKVLWNWIPGSPEAHYRLGQAYVHAGQKDNAQEEFEVYQRFRAPTSGRLDKESAEVRQFVYSEKDQTPGETL